jgi:O-antigen/teichoic acid export membrane protein
MLSASAFLSAVVMVGLAALLPRLFPDIPAPLVHDARIALLWVGGSLAAGLPLAAISGVFTGIQRNEVAATIIVGSRVLTAVGLIWAAASGYGLVTMAKIFALINVGTYLAQWAAFRWFVPTLTVSPRKVSRDSLKELIDYCTSLTVWSFAMLLVSGLDLVLVARFDFAAVGAFAIAAGLVNLLQGVQGVIMNAFLPVAATLDAQGDRPRLVRLLLRTTRWNLLSLGIALLLYILIGRLVLAGYIGLEYLTEVAAILSILLLAATIRLSMLPYNIVVMGTGDHRRIIVGPIAEGVSNLIASAFLGWHFGAIGVAWGTVVGGVVGVTFHLALNLPRSVRLGVDVATFASGAFIPALIAVMPLMIVAILQASGVALSRPVSMVAAVAALAFVLLAWHITLTTDERLAIVSKMRRR